MHAPLGSLIGVAGAVEVVGGTLIVLGALTRPVAVALALEMASALAMVNRRFGHARDTIEPRARPA